MRQLHTEDIEIASSPSAFPPGVAGFPLEKEFTGWSFQIAE